VSKLQLIAECVVYKPLALEQNLDTTKSKVENFARVATANIRLTQ